MLPINPESLGAPRGYSNGMLAPAGGRLLFVAGQIGWDEDQNLVPGGFAEQFAQALANVVTVVREAGGEPSDLGNLTLFVVDTPGVSGSLETSRRCLPQDHGAPLPCHGPDRRPRPARTWGASGDLGASGDSIMTIDPKSFRYQFDAETNVATITLNRPERLNALTFEIYDELREVFEALDVEPEVRAIVLTGAGDRAFCTGGDVNDIIGELHGRDYQGLLDFTRRTGALILAMLRCRRPIVGALNGQVAGAGAVIATACDLRIASDDARIAYLFTKVGLSGADMGASWLLPRIVGIGRSMELLMTGDFVDPETAHRIGIYNRVVPKGKVRDEARQWAERLARGPSFGLEVTKKMVYREAAMDLESALAAEVEIQAACMEDPNFRESYDAFVAKRKPKFT